LAATAAESTRLTCGCNRRQGFGEFTDMLPRGFFKPAGEGAVTTRTELAEMLAKDNDLRKRPRPLRRLFRRSKYRACMIHY
jgi:hypothetical protein